MLRCLLTCRSLFARVQRSGKDFLKYEGGRSSSRIQHISQKCDSPAVVGHHGTTQETETSSRSKPGRAKAVHDLSFLISERNARSLSPRLQTPHDIKAFYRAVKAKGLLHQLSSEELSSIMQLFASLSMLPDSANLSSASGDDNVGAIAFHPLALTLHKHQVSGTRKHWAFVLSVAKDKISRGSSLADSDNYWLMRAALEDVKRAVPQDPKGVRQCLDRARNYYTHIRHVNNEWLVHRVYLTTLLDYGGHASGDEVVMHLGNLLSWNGGLHPSLIGIFWRVLALPGDVSSSTKARFLRVLRKRLSRVRDVLPGPSRSTDYTSGALDKLERPMTYDALAIRDYFVDVIFSFKPGTHHTLRYLRDVYPWVLFESRVALCAFNDGTYATSEEEDRAAWSNLVLLSLSFAAARKVPGCDLENVTPKRGLDGGLYSQAQVLGWTVICSLAALSSELRLRSHTRKDTDLPSSEGIQEIARTLWVLWRKEEAWRAGAMMRPMALVCSATTSFMALATVSGDSRLAISLVRYISDAVIYPTQLGEEALDWNMLQACAVHFAILTATKGVGGPPHHLWDGILGALRYAQLIPDGVHPNALQWSSAVAKAMLVDLAQLDALLSHRLLVSSHEYGLTMDDGVVLAIGKALAFDEHHDVAFELLKDERISGHSASFLLDSLLSNVLRHGNLHLDLIRSFVKVFANTSIRPTNGRALESFIQVCMQAGYLKESARIVENVCESNPSLLRSHFLAHLASTLVSHRHYRLLGGVLKDAWHKALDSRASIFRSSRFHYTRRLLARCPMTSSREVARSLPFSIYVWPVLRDHIPFHPRLAHLDKKIISLKLSSQLQKSRKLDEKTLERAVHLLVDAGRITSALKLLSKHSPTISTKAGNIILSESLRPRASRRQRRQVRHASARLAQLVRERGFIPDRVTLNLLMKALLRWQSITPKATLRALFDRLTMSGYPIPENALNAMSTSTPNTPSATGQSRASPTTSRTVFGTDTLPVAKGSLPVDLEAFPKNISFTRHTRPLYKMFIKAFNLRGDKEGARRVASVLRSLNERVMRENAIRAEARRLGRIRARERLKRGNMPADGS